MGILNEVVSAVEGATEHHAGLAAHVAELLAPSSTGAPGQAAGLGGLSGLVEKMTAGGLGHVVQSWIGTGANLPISAEQLQAVLGSDVLRSMAAKVGLPVDRVAPMLAQILPGLVDKMTPGGQAPAPAAS
jgi:uncharacterized protein YidB (DUF937 family)